MTEKLIFMRQYLKTDPKQSMETFLTECIKLFSVKQGKYPNRGMCQAGVTIIHALPEILFTQSKLCQPNNLFLWYEDTEIGVE